MNENQELFVDWLRENQPLVYRKAIQTTGVGLGATDKTNWWDSFVGAVKDIVPIVIGARTQKRIINTQMKRAEQGLPPLDVDQMSPTVRVQAGMTPAMKKILIPSLAIGAALILFMIMKKK